MALRIQGKHLASKSRLIIDPFPELQMTWVGAKSREGERRRVEMGGQEGETKLRVMKSRKSPPNTPVDQRKPYMEAPTGASAGYLTVVKPMTCFPSVLVTSDRGV